MFFVHTLTEEHCHEDFAVLGQSCAKCFCKATTKISNEFYHRGLTIIIFLRIFGTRSIKNSKKLANFSNFQSISIHAHPQRQTTGNSFSTFKQSLTTKLDHQFWNSIDAKAPQVLAFYKVAKQRDNEPLIARPAFSNSLGLKSVFKKLRLTVNKAAFGPFKSILWEMQIR